jgi:GAF domain-containing protein
VTQTGLPRIALDAGADAVHFNNPDLPDTRSEMTLPLQVSGRVLGALDLQTTQPAAFSDEDLTVLGTLADQVAVAIDNARLFTRTLAALQETEEVNKRRLREQWQRLLPTLRQTSHEYHLSGVPAAGDAVLPEIDQVLRRGEVVIAGDDALGQQPDGVAAARTALAVPIKLRDQVIGVIDLQEMDEDRRWTDDDVAVVLAVADQAALSLENARLLDETERSAQRERTINEINSRVRQTIDLDSILQTAVKELGQTLGAARVTARIGRTNAPASPSTGNGRGQGDDHA